jgi:hypothetical protein
MRKINSLILIICFALVMVLPLVPAATNYNSPSIETTLLSQDPDPVEPGQIVRVKFKIENEGIETNEDVIVKILPKFPFSSYDNVIEKNIGKLQSSSTGADAAVVEFRLKVDEKATEGDTELELTVLIGADGGISYTNDEFLINIQTHDAVLDITSITSEPKQIAPGESAEVTIMVKNLADSLLKDIKFKLDFDDDDLPLAPYQSSSERRISQLQSSYQNSLSFNIIADPEATPGLYKVPVTITYNDEKGNAYSVSDILAVTVGEIPKLKAYIKKSAVLQAKSEGKITLEIANSGSSNIKFLEMTLLPSDDYKLVSTTDYFYLGDVDSDDTESEEVDIYINKKVETLHVPMLLKYTDANNKPFQQQVELEMNLYSSSELKRFGLVERSSAGVYFLIFVLAVVAFILYRSYKKDPEKFSRRWKRRLSFRSKKK